jgi:DNA ligase (NAD+)
MNSIQFLQRLKSLTKEELLNLHGVGEVLADNIIDFTESKRYQKLIQDFETLQSKGTQIEIVQQAATQIEGTLSGETICITGTFDKSRNAIKAELETKGARIVEAVTKKTTLLLAGLEAGSKLQKAKKLGIRVETNYENL